MQGKKHYSEKLFTSFQLSARVPENNYYRRLKEVLDLRWLYHKTRKYYGTEGQKSIDPVVFFKMILIGYTENLGSDRKIIDMVSMRMDMLYFLGYDIDEELPWHSTLSRTRQLFGQEVFRTLFRKVLSQCIDKGMVAGCRQAIDSVHLKANASLSSIKRKEVLKDGELYAVSLKEEQQQDKGDGDHWSNKTHYSSTDPDAKIATKPGKSTDLKYLGQVSVDTAEHVITEVQVHHADKRDSQCLEEMVSGAMHNLQQEGIVMEEVLSDSGYSSTDALQCLEQNGLTGYIPNHGRYKTQRDGFTYDQENDCYVCSQGVQLKYIGTGLDKEGQPRKEYRSSATDCRNCPLRKQCIGKAAHKRIRELVNKHLFEQMHRRMQTKHGRAMMKIRQSTVEPVLGTLVNHRGIRRINTRGIQQANKCLLMAAVAYNLKKMLKFKAPKVKVLAKMKEKVHIWTSISTNILLHTVEAIKHDVITIVEVFNRKKLITELNWHSTPG
jgi:transposase